MTLEGREKREKTSNDIRVCQQCGKVLSKLYREDICPVCKEINLFSQVKEYIRANDVKEMDVAKEFDIPIRKVRGWIKEGRIQYKINDKKNKMGTIYCQMCGKPLEFGLLCHDCRKLKELEVVGNAHKEDKASMRFLGKENTDDKD